MTGENSTARGDGGVLRASRTCIRRCATCLPRRTGTTPRSTRSIRAGSTPFEFDIDEAVGPEPGPPHAADDAGHAAIARRGNRRPRDRQSQRPAPGLAQIVRDSSFYYLLGYNSTQAPTDGKFHEITVRVKRRGLDVRARKGYWALTAEEIVRANTPTAGDAEAGAARRWPRSRHRSRPASTSGRGSGRARRRRQDARHAVWEPLPQPPGAAARSTAPGRVSLIAADREG